MTEGGDTIWSSNNPVKLNTMNFGQVIEALKEGKCIKRTGWNGSNMFVFKHVPNTVSITFVPNMQSVPESAKLEFIKREEDIHYKNQMVIVKPDNTIDSWVPSSSDVFAEDWVIL